LGSLRGGDLSLFAIMVVVASYLSETIGIKSQNKIRRSKPSGKFGSRCLSSSRAYSNSMVGLFMGTPSFNCSKTGVHFHAAPWYMRETIGLDVILGVVMIIQGRDFTHNALSPLLCSAPKNKNHVLTWFITEQ
jgi:hypothetical protein